MYLYCQKQRKTPHVIQGNKSRKINKYALRTTRSVDTTYSGKENTSHKNETGDQF